jgi:hypothetical protein
VLPEGVAAPDVRVYAVRKDGTRGPKGAPVVVATPAEDGAFHLPLARPEEHWVLTTISPSARLRRAWVDGSSLRPGETFSLAPRLAPRLRVTAVAPDGRPVEGAHLNLRAAAANEVAWAGPEDPAMGVVMMAMAPDGAEVTLLHDTPVFLRVSAPRTAAWRRVLEPVEQEVRAVLEPSATLTVHVGGDVVTGDVISASLRSLPPPTAAETIVAVGFASAEGNEATITLADGIGPGAYEIDLLSTRHRPARVTGVLVQAYGEEVEARARLEALSDVGSLRLAFREADGRAARPSAEAGPVVVARRAGDPTGAWRFLAGGAAADGTVTLSHVPSGAYDLLFSFRKPARAAFARSVVVRSGETTEAVATIEAALWTRVPADAAEALDAEVVGRDGGTLPRLFDEGGSVHVADPGEAPVPNRPLGPYPASAGPLRWRWTQEGARREVELAPTAR